MIKNIARTFIGQIEINIIGEIDDGWRVGSCLLADFEGVLVGEVVTDHDCELAGKSLATIGANIA